MSGSYPADGPAGSAGDQVPALMICRLALDPVSGELRHRTEVGIAVRAALFVELIEAGRLAGTRVPRPSGPSVTDGGLADSVHRAVAGRRPTTWRHWFSHTRSDVDAAVTRLIDDGTFVVDGGRYRDVDPDRMVLARAQVEGLLAIGTGGAALADIVLALLAGSAGLAGARPRPRRHLGQVAPMIPLLPEDLAERESIRAAVRAALIVMRKRRGFLGLR